MNLMITKKLAGMVCLVVAICALTSVSSRAQSYNIADLGALLGTNSFAYGINNNGQVVGYWTGTNGAHAFLYSAGAVTDLGGLGGVNQYALSINSSGQIVGFGAATNGMRAFLYKNGSLTNLGTLGGLNSYAYGINDSGQIVGYIDTTNGARAYFYSTNGTTEVGTLGGTNSYAFGVNNSNTVVGSSWTAASLTHAFIWQGGGLTNLNAMISTNSGWVLNDARGINNSGKIVGWGVTNGLEQAFLFSAGQITRIGLLPGAVNSFAFSINNSNQVVGASTLSNSTSRPFLWYNGTLTDLNDLLPAGFNWDLREARGINDKGQIVGWGITNGQEHAFILCPNTAPSVVLTNPANNAVFSTLSSITLKASASDPDGSVSKVEFFRSSIKLGESAVSPYEITWSGVGPGVYTLKASATDNSGATNVSSAINIIVATPPTITTQPQNQKIATGSNVTFTVVVSGDSPISYQWQFNGGDISGATDSSYTISNVQTIQGGAYSTVATNIAGTVTSSSALLTVTIDSRNIGKGDWIYFLSDATNRLGQNVQTVTNLQSLMNFERVQGMQYLIVKCGDGGTIWNQFDSNLIYHAHVAGLKILGYGRVYGTNIAGEIAVATNALGLGADGFVIDAEIEYESQNLTNNAAVAAQYCQGIRSAYPDAFVAYAPFVYISQHSSFPYVAFGTNCDAVMPQCYWKSFGVTASNMVMQLNTEWKNWHNSLTGASTNAIKPISPVGQGWSLSSSNITTGAEIAEFINGLKTTTNAATAGGYKGVSFWRADLHTQDMWDRLGSTAIGNPNGAPLIVSQPQSQTVTNGTAALLTVTASGAAILNYQWRLNGVSIPGATTSSYSIAAAQSTNVGVYSIVVSNAVGAALSADAVVSIVGYPLWIETFESGLGNWATAGASDLINSTTNHTAGGTNSARVSNSGNRMYRNLDAEIEGNTKLTFWLYDSTQTREYGEVRAYTGNGFGGAAGIQQILAIGRYNSSFGTGTGTLTNETVDSTKYQARVYAGANSGWLNLNNAGAPARAVGWHKFEIERLSDGTTIKFYVDGILGRTITAATAATWDSVTIGSIGSGTTSGDAWFDDISPQIVGVPVISTQPSNFTVFAGTNVTFSVSASGNIMGYQWRLNGVNIPGATSSSLTVTNVQSPNVGDYTVVIANPVGATISSAASLAVLYPPTIITQPTNQTVASGTTVTLTGVAGGPGPFTYQWKKDGVVLTNGINISGALSGHLIISNATPTIEGSYVVTVSNPAGSITSETAMITVDGSVVFADNFEGGLTNWFVVPGATSLALAVNEVNPVTGFRTAFETNSLTKMYHNIGSEISGRSRATFWIHDANNGETTTRSFGEVRSFTGTGFGNGTLEQVLAIGNYTVPFDVNSGSLTGEVADPGRYQARVLFGTNSGWFNLNSPSAPGRSAGWHKFSIEKSADGASAHFFVDGQFGRTISGVTGASWDVVEIGSAGIGVGVDEAVWFDDVKVETLTNVITMQPASLTVVTGATAVFSVGATGANITYQWRKNGAVIAGATQSSYAITNANVSNQSAYSVLVTTVADREYSALAELVVVQLPTISVHPLSQAIGVGTNVAFSVTASGRNISYQWKKNGTIISNGYRIDGATASALTILGASHADDAVYSVVVSNIAGSVTSSPATLTVVDLPSITVQPSNQVVGVGSNAVFSVAATGTAPLVYQWKKNGAPVTDSGRVFGSATAALTITGASPSDIASYCVSVSNQLATVTSSVATLSVLTAPTIITQPISHVICPGAAATFTVNAGGNQLIYQWKKNGISLTNNTHVVGATAASLLITNASQLDVGTYLVTVSNIAGAAASTAVDLSLSNAVFVDLDIDSDNNNAFGTPDRTGHEEEIEDSVLSTGKLIVVNNGDANGNNVPDFADGFNGYGSGATNLHVNFVPLILHLSLEDVSGTKVRFNYSASSPTSLTNNGTGGSYLAAPGRLRLWKKDGTVPRTVDTDYVVPGIDYSPTNFGIDRLHPVAILYVEGIDQSSTNGDEIRVDVTFDNASACAQSDLVRVTVDFDSDGDSLVDSLEQTLGTNPVKPDTDGDGRSDAEELQDATDPLSNASVVRRMLTAWKFPPVTNAVMFGRTEDGQEPTSTVNVWQSIGSWDNYAADLQIPRNPSPDQIGLSYNRFKSPTRPNLTPNRGSLSMWFQPNWQSSNAVVAGTNQLRYSLLNLSQTGNSETNELPGAYWGLEVNGNGTAITFCTARATNDSQKMQWLTTNINWLRRITDKTNAWHHIALSYSETNIALYIDGAIAGVTNSTELGSWPGTNLPSNPWRIWIGGRLNESLANGSYDCIETFNYPMTTEEVVDKYHSVADLDSDGDGVSDLEELRRGLNIHNPDSDGDNLPDGWEVRFGRDFAQGGNWLDPLVGSAGEDPDGDERDNLHEYLFGTNPLVNDQPLSDLPPYDVVGTTNDRSQLINIDFTTTNKSVGPRGPAAAGIDGSDLWTVIPAAGDYHGLADASGSIIPNAWLIAAYTPINLTFHGSCWETNLINETQGELSCEEHAYPCAILQSLISPGVGTPQDSLVTTDDPDVIGVVVGPDDYPPDYWPPPNPPGGGPSGPPRWPEPEKPVVHPPFRPPPRPRPAECTNEICVTIGQTVQMAAIEESPWSSPDYQQFAVNAAGFDNSGSLPGLPNTISTNAMFSDFAFCSQDTRFNERIDHEVCGYTDVDRYYARAEIDIQNLPGKHYRLYLYCSPNFSSNDVPLEASRPQTIVINPLAVVKTNGLVFKGGHAITVPPQGSRLSRFIANANYAVTNVDTLNGHILLYWKYKNAAINGLQLVELRPLVRPVVTGTNVFAGAMLQWKVVPTALEYEVYRRGTNDTAFSKIATTKLCYYHDTEVAPLPNTATKTYTYWVRAKNEVYTSDAAPIDVAVSAPVVNESFNYPPVLNYIRPLVQAYTRMPFTFGSPKIQGAADAYDYERVPLRFLVTEILGGTVRWTERTGTNELTIDLTNDQLQQELTNGTRRIIGPTVTVTWTPPDNAHGDVPLLKVRAFDGSSMSFNAAIVSVNVKPQSMLLWWGNYSYGMSGGGQPSMVPTQLNDQFTINPDPRSWFSYRSSFGAISVDAFDKSFYTKVPAPVALNFDAISLAQGGTNLPIVNGTLRNVVTLAGTTKLAAPWGNRLALTADGSVWVWGIGTAGQIGDGLEQSPDEVNTNLIPWSATREQPFVSRVNGISDGVSIASDGFYSLVAKTDGTVWGWGASSVDDHDNVFWNPGGWSVSPLPEVKTKTYSGVTYSMSDWDIGRAGRLNSRNVFSGMNTPVQIPGLKNIVQVAAATTFCAALSADGDVYRWGFWDDSSHGPTSGPVRVAIDERVTQIAATEASWGGYGIALTKNGHVYEWTDDGFSAVRIPQLEGVTQIAASFDCRLALLDTGKVVQWGRLGSTGGYFETGGNVRTWYWPGVIFPGYHTIEGLTNVVSVSASYGSAFAVDANHRLWGWGVDTYGIFGSDFKPEIVYKWGSVIQGWIPSRIFNTPIRLGNVKDVEIAATFDMNAYAAAVANDVVQNLSVRPADQSAILNWDFYPGVNQYQIKRSDQANGQYGWIANVSQQPLNRQSYVDSSLLNGPIITRFR